MNYENLILKAPPEKKVARKCELSGWLRCRYVHLFVFFFLNFIDEENEQMQKFLEKNIEF